MSESGSATQDQMAWNRAWLLALPAMVAVSVALYHTRFGPEVTGDGVQYIAGGRSLSQGEIYGMPVGDGSIRPIVGFPPMFSTLLAVPALLGPDPLDLARWVNALFFGANILLASVLCLRYTKSLAASLLLSAWLLASSALLQVHAAAMSEASFILLTLLALLALQQYFSDHRRTWAILAGLTIGFTILTRYAGLSLVPAAAASVLLLGGEQRRKKGIDAVLLTVAAAIPFGYWTLHNLAVAGSATSRPFAWLLSRTRLTLMLGEVSSWVFPEQIARRTRILLLMGLLSAVVVILDLLLRAASRRDRKLLAFPATALITAASYLAMLGMSISFLDATLDITIRYLSPLAFIIAPAAFGMGYYWLADQPPLSRGLVVLGAVALIGVNAFHLVEFVADPGPVFGYMDTRRFGSGTIDAILKLESSIPIITNEREKVYILTGRPSYSTPIGVEHFTQEKRDDLEQQMEAYHQRLADGAVLALFDTYAFHDRSPTTADLIAGLVTIADTDDGQIWVDPEAWAGRLPK